MLPLTPTTSGREENGNQATSAGSPLLAMTNTNLVLFAGPAYGLSAGKKNARFKASRSLSSNTPSRTSEPGQRFGFDILLPVSIRQTEVYRIASATCFSKS